MLHETNGSPLFCYMQQPGCLSQGPAEGLVQQGLLQRIEGGELAVVEGFEALGFFLQCFEIVRNPSLFGYGWHSELEVLDLLPADVRDANPCLNAKNMPGECSTSDEIH